MAIASESGGKISEEAKDNRQPVEEANSDEDEIELPLTDKQKEEICSEIIIPFDSISDVTDIVQECIREVLAVDLDDIKLIPSQFEKFKKCVVESFFSTIISPQTPIGPITGDTIGQQTTQSNLNTFHSAGSAKSGGSDGIREGISVSEKRKIEYSTIHFKNTTLTFDEVMNYRKDFIGTSIKSLTSANPKLYPVNFKNYLHSEKGGVDWWYYHSNLSDLISYSNEEGFSGDPFRSCIRLKFDIQKLYEFRITTQQIADIINKYVFCIKFTKDGRKCENEVKCKCICSPTIVGIVDVFISQRDKNLDFYLVSVLQFDEFSKIYVSGIPGITNFYAIKNNVTSIIRDGENKDGKLQIYLNDNRFKNIPFSRVKKLIEASGYKMTNKYDFMFDYRPAFPPELRSEIILEALSYRQSFGHAYYNVEQIDKNVWKLTINLNYINSGYVFYSLENVILQEFENPNLISATREKIIDYIIVDTTDNYETFMKKIKKPILQSLDKGEGDGEFIYISLKDNRTNEFGWLINHTGYNFSFNGRFVIRTSDKYDTVLKKLEATEETKLKTYVYAETSGAKLKETLLNPNVNRKKTWCNNFRQIFNVFGIEALRNFLALDFKNMINANGYVNGKFLELVADVETYAGINPMTSEGILCHGRGSLAYATFDKVLQHLFKSMLSGKKESTDSTSISIIIGEQIKFGTGGFSIQKDETKLALENLPNMDYSSDTATAQLDRYDQIDSDIHATSYGIIGNDDFQDILVIEIPSIIKGKLKMVPWIYDKIIIKDKKFYIQQGIDIISKLKRTANISMINLSTFIEAKNKIVPKISVVPIDR